MILNIPCIIFNEYKFKGKKQKDLLTMIYTVIELQNITKIYRLKKYFNAPSEDIK